MRGQTTTCCLEEAGTPGAPREQGSGAWRCRAVSPTQPGHPHPHPQPPLWPSWHGLDAPGSLELAGIKGRKTILCPRPLRQESMAPGDRVHSHKARVGQSRVPGLAPGVWEQGTLCPAGRGPSPSLPSTEDLHRARGGVPLPGGGSQRRVGPGSFCHLQQGPVALTTQGRQSLAHHRADRNHGGRGYWVGPVCPECPVV